jgi:signal transduction histidine kinase
MYGIPTDRESGTYPEFLQYGIGQVLINLIGNAIKYSPNGQRIIISTGLNDGMIRVNIQDFGIGMSDETRQKIFERFSAGPFVRCMVPGFNMK